MMRLLLAVIACVSAALPSSAFACKCVSGQPFEVFKKTQVVAEGKVVAVTQPEREPTTVRYTFQVSKVWKGADQGDRVTVVADKQGACAVKLAQGQSYILAATDEGMGFASVKPCHPFFKAANAKDAATTRKNLDGLKKQLDPDQVVAANEGEADVKEAAAKALAAKKKKKR